MESITSEKITAEFVRDSGGDVLLKTVYDEYGKYLYWILFSHLGRDHARSAEVFNDLFVELAEKDCRRLRMFQGRSSFRTYLTSVWRNMLIDLLRKKGNESLVDYVDPGMMESVMSCNSDSMTPEMGFIQGENEAGIRKLLSEAMRMVDGLTPDEKMVLRLRINQGRKFEDINRMTGIKNSNYMFRAAMQRIRNSMTEESREVFMNIIEER